MCDSPLSRFEILHDLVAVWNNLSQSRPFNRAVPLTPLYPVRVRLLGRSFDHAQTTQTRGQSSDRPGDWRLSWGDDGSFGSRVRCGRGRTGQPPE